MTLKEHIDDIRNDLKEGVFGNEAAVSQGIVLRLLQVLDWPIFDIRIVVPEYTVEKRRVDFALRPPSLNPLIFIEVKQVGNIEGAEEQLSEYAYYQGVKTAILTDGRKWQFFYALGEGNYRGRLVRELDFIEEDSEISAEYLHKYLNYALVRDRKSIEYIENDYKQKRIEETLPKAWGNTLAEVENAGTTFGIEIIAETVENLCGYRPTDERVLDFLKGLGSEPKKGLESEPNLPPVDPPSRNTRRRNTRLFVTMPNGEEINHKIAASTFAEVIKKLGIERVRSLNKEGSSPLISVDELPRYGKYGQYYIKTDTSTAKKKSCLRKLPQNLVSP